MIPPSSTHAPPVVPYPALVLDHLRIETTGASLQIRESGYELEPRRLTTHNFIYISRGKVIWEIDAIPMEGGAGDLFRVPAGLPHRAWSITPAVRIISFHVRVRLPNGLDAFEFLRPPVLLHRIQGSRLEEWLERGGRELEPTGMPPERRRFLPGYGHLIVHEYLTLVGERGLGEPAPLDPVVRSVLDYLTANASQTLDLTQIAARAGFSPQHLNRLFVRQIGVTPLRVHHRLRMDHAAHLLLQSDWTVAAVGEAVGYPDPGHFSRVFKRHFGRSPAEYRSAT